jgi:OPT oligopeptide transporter protein
MHYGCWCEFGSEQLRGATGTISNAVSRATLTRRNVKLFYDAKVNATTAVLATFSTACFGYGIVGLLRPLTVYPAEMVKPVQRDHLST